ncbi:tRNA(Ile)-lysidine synthetase, tilS [Lactococcus cremoris]|nr:tRNA(Ile)-lysidine synthetase, tilS [Lactococcus cremoris]
MGMLLRRHRLKKEDATATDEVVEEVKNLEEQIQEDGNDETETTDEVVEESLEITKPNSRSKKDEIKAYLTSKEIEFNESATNEELLALVE